MNLGREVHSMHSMLIRNLEDNVQAKKKKVEIAWLAEEIQYETGPSSDGEEAAVVKQS